MIILGELLTFQMTDGEKHRLQCESSCCRYVFVCAHVYIHMCVCVYVRMCVSVYCIMPTSVHTHTYTHIYIHTYTQARVQSIASVVQEGESVRVCV